MMGLAEYAFLGGLAVFMVGLAVFFHWLERPARWRGAVFPLMAGMWLGVAAGVTSHPFREAMAAAMGLPYPLWVWASQVRRHQAVVSRPAAILLPAVGGWGIFAILDRSTLFAGLAAGVAFAGLTVLLIEGRARLPEEPTAQLDRPTVR